VIKIVIKDTMAESSEEIEIAEGTKLLTLAENYREHHCLPIIGALYNNLMVDLYTEVEKPGTIVWLDITSYYGMSIYKQSLIMLLVQASQTLFPNWDLTVDHALGKHCYCEFVGTTKPSKRTLELLEAQMREFIAADEPIVPNVMAADEAIPMLEAAGYRETSALLKRINKKTITIYQMGKQIFHSFYALAPSAGSLSVFGLIPYEDGFLLRFPGVECPGILAPLAELPKLTTVLRETDQWGKILKVENVSGLFRTLDKGPAAMRDLIHISEALQEKYIANLADEIYEDRDRLRVILIAGPSSSGKTTFCYRLATQLRVMGLRPITLSTDDYFLNREDTPKDKDGAYDFESLRAIDIGLFNDNLQALIKGEKVMGPVFDFKKGQRLDNVKSLQVEPGHPIIVEGIHALNEALTPTIGRAMKFKIYISSLVQVDIDSYNRVATSDARLIRRLVRDAQYRSKTAADTLSQWRSVRRGEEENIFPFQEEADAMFNSALIYETGVFKKYATPLLEQVTSDLPQYADAQRLLNLLSYFPDIDDSTVPLNSILREFIGGGSIHVD
jgi:uridine kinase